MPSTSPTRTRTPTSTTSAPPTPRRTSRRIRPRCGVPEVGAGPVACAVGRLGDCGMIVSCVAAAALSDLRPAGRLAGVAGPLYRVEGCRAARAAARGRRPATGQPQAAAGLGRSGGPGRVDPAAAEAGEGPPAGQPGFGPALASPAGREAVDLP